MILGLDLTSSRQSSRLPAMVKNFWDYFSRRFSLLILIGASIVLIRAFLAYLQCSLTSDELNNDDKDCSSTRQESQLFFYFSLGIVVCFNHFLREKVSTGRMMQNGFWVKLDFRPMNVEYSSQCSTLYRKSSSMESLATIPVTMHLMMLRKELLSYVPGTSNWSENTTGSQYLLLARKVLSSQKRCLKISPEIIFT